MKSISKIIIGAAIAGGTVFSACSDWTESEAFKVNETNIEDQNPELYAEYLANLREYRNTDHKLVYAWFDNSVKQSYSRANHLTDIPDSIDVVSLMYPDKLVKSEAAEIEQIRGEKGMKVIFNIDFEAIKSTYDAMVEDATEEEKNIRFCNSGVMAFDGKVLFDLLSKINSNNAAGEYYLTDTVKIARQMGLKCSAIETSAEEVAGANTQEELAQLETYLKRRGA